MREVFSQVSFAKCDFFHILTHGEVESLNHLPICIWLRGGMVDTMDSKSIEATHVGSSPTGATIYF